MFVDIAKITIKAGDGGDGAVGFHREKYVANGGPDGGDGGRGGDIVFTAHPGMRTLLDFKYKRKYLAQRGENGRGGRLTGKDATSMVIEVPAGTVVKDAETGKVVADLYAPGVSRVVLRGGRGGRGNARFATSTRQAPRFAQTGQRTQEHTVTLELKTIADVGLVGFPNVGKSTLLSAMTAARPKIANYHFTTLTPNLGVVRQEESEYVIADIPGLVEGAHEGTGLGHDFLRHIERTRILVHMVDISGSEGRDPLSDYDLITEELERYSAELPARVKIAAANKMDIEPDADENLEKLRDKLKGTGIEVCPLSAAGYQGVTELAARISACLREAPEATVEWEQEAELNQLEASEYSIDQVEEGLFVLEGTLVERMLRTVNLEDDQSFQNFQRSLKLRGIIDALREAGCGEGDTVRLGEVEFDFIE